MAGFKVDTMAVGAWEKLSVIEASTNPQRMHARYAWRGERQIAPVPHLSGRKHRAQEVIKSPEVPNLGWLEILPESRANRKPPLPVPGPVRFYLLPLVSSLHAHAAGIIGRT